MQAVAESYPALPILSHVLLEAHAPDTLALRATDVEIGRSRHCPALVPLAGAGTADARRLYALVRTLPPGVLTLESSAAHGLTIMQDKRRFRLPSLDPTEFPHLAPAGDTVQTITLPATQLKELLDRSSFAVCADDTRVQLHSVLLSCEQNEQVRYAASDGHRLAVIERPAAGLTANALSMLLPYKGVTEARRLLDDVMTLTCGATILVLMVGSTTLSLRLVEGEFPEYERVIPRTPAARLLIPRAELMAALRRVMVLTTERARGVKCDMRANTLVLSAHTPDLGEAQEEVAIDYQGDALSIGFNGRYLLDFCTAIEPEPQIVMELANEAAPALLRVESDPHYRYVVMPMRLA
jgi:DNA polymerase-3 subunit beta